MKQSLFCQHYLLTEGVNLMFTVAVDLDNYSYKIQEALFNIGLHMNLITLAHLSYLSDKQV